MENKKLNKKAIIAALVVCMIPAMATACPSHHVSSSKPVPHRQVRHEPIRPVVRPVVKRHVVHSASPVVVYHHAEYVPLPEDRYRDYQDSYSYSEYSEDSYSSDSYSSYNVVEDDCARRGRSCDNGEFQQGEAPRQDKIEYEYFCVNGVWYHARVWHKR